MRKSKEVENTETGKWMDKYYHKSQLNKLGGWLKNKLFNGIFSLTKRRLAGSITEMAVNGCLLIWRKGDCWGSVGSRMRRNRKNKEGEIDE